MIIAFSFIAGIIIGYCIAKFIKIDIKVGIKKDAVKQIKQQPNTEIDNIKEMLSEIQTTGTLNLPLNSTIINCLKEIANTPDWENQIDKETFTNLSKISKKWKIYNIKTQHNVAKVSGTHFKEVKHWEGTFEEYKKAIENNEIDENTEVSIIDDENEPAIWYSMSEQGVEEFMK